MCWMMLGIGRFMLVSLSVVMIQSGITTGQQQQQQSNNAGFVHPIATETFPVNRPTAEAAPQQPAEEIPTSTEPAQSSAAPVKQQKPMFQVPVTLPFVMQRPQTANGKPTSYLRPVGVMVDPISQDEPVQPVQPVRQTKPWYANLPQEEDLSSAPGVAVTLPFRTKPASYLRPVFVVDESNDDQPAVEDVQPAIQTRPYYFPTRNVAVTLPFNLRPASTSGNGGPSEQKIPVRSKPLSYLRPVIVAADADGAAGTPEGDDDYYYAPAQQDFTSPISGAVQPSPPQSQAVMAIPLVQPPVKATKPASYLRPWFVDDSYATPVRATKPWRPQEIAAQVDDDSAGYNQRPVSWLAYRASPAVMGPHSVRPLIQRRPIAPPSGVWLQSRPLIANFLLAVDAEDPRLLEPFKVDQLLPIKSAENGGAEQQQEQQQVLVKPLVIALAVDHRHPIKQKRPGPMLLLPTVPDVESSIAGAGQAEARVPFRGNWANNNNNNLLEKTQVVGSSTLVYTKQNLLQTGTSTVYTSTVFTVTTTVQNAYCYTSANPGGGNLAPAPWCSFRRKRSTLPQEEEEEESAILSIDGELFQPSQVEKILMTAVPSALDRNEAIDSTLLMAEDVPANGGEKLKVRGRFLNLATNFIAGRPTTTVTVTALTFVTEIAITSTTAITFASGQCVPRCLQNLPVCAQ
ncbi:uncharacterized protein LOC124197151 isoform X3 [Daphnia pulex]|uniref:uncharacterized protein LOC124197151 isoform X3 n=1 Tax=Daphnia pulex TaxID=6669 RepID=UPI001EDE01D4|nr:uncharacterized protein LOC124197151 isoform X3 [Daphnia pulex]